MMQHSSVAKALRTLKMLSILNSRMTAFASLRLALVGNEAFALRRLVMKNVTLAVAELGRLWVQKTLRLLHFVVLTAHAWLTQKGSQPLPMRYGQKVLAQ